MKHWRELAYSRALSPQRPQALAQSLEPAEFQRGHMVFAEGDRLYIISPAR
ncbi:hypothetical protein BJ970_006749 [Saccharopolyspora phatthalungensis]|uniref:Uncharacterized protein n=1 Tax=Saccharopolyspora phatthalungensis TaxID=664693 RepID=A0A840QGQ7_9PSEU|nr:hypothetical protein [Saccharopolyspora phatthalungensis]